MNIETGTLGMLKNIARTHQYRLIGTFSLVAAENALLLLYSLFGSFAINAIVAGKVWTALLYAALVLVIWLVGAARRAVDTRAFTRIYTDLVVPMIVRQRLGGTGTSTLSARVALSRSFVDFFEHHLPTLVTSLVSIFGAALMLLFIEFWSGVACLVILAIFTALLPRYTRTNDSLYHRLNNRLEKDVDIIGGTLPHGLSRHYNLIARLRVRISNREATGYLAIGVAICALFGTTIALLAVQHGKSAGHIYAVLSYLWIFAISLDDGPRLVEHFSELKDIGKRVSAEEETTA